MDANLIGVSLFPVFLIGMLGSVHCVGMCSGIVGALSIAPRRKFPVAVTTARRQLVANGQDGAVRVVAYNMGRIGSYTVAGALAGGLAHGAGALAGISTIQLGGYWLVNSMLVALGLYLMGVWHGLTRVEAIGLGIWRRLQPLTKRLAPLDSPLKMFAVGSIWGWLPCAMVYSMLLTALMSGSALTGAAVMLAFGFGTLPALFTLGMLGAKLRAVMQHRLMRVACGLIVLCFGLLGLMRAAGGPPSSWLDSVCVPHVATAGAL